MKIYEMIFYGDSPKKIPFICEITRLDFHAVELSKSGE